jgi:hypothetical protein
MNAASQQSQQMPKPNWKALRHWRSFVSRSDNLRTWHVNTTVVDHRNPNAISTQLIPVFLVFLFAHFSKSSGNVTQKQDTSALLYEERVSFSIA